jgi:hypothetical protein
MRNNFANMNILIAISDSYVPYAAVMLQSLVDSNPKLCFNVYIICPDVTAENLKKRHKQFNNKNYTPTPTEFRKFMESLGINSQYATVDNLQNQLSELITDKWINYLRDHDTSLYDATKTTEYKYPISNSQQIEMKDAVLSASMGKDLKEVDFNNKSNKFESTGDSLKASELAKDDYKIIETRYSAYGSTMIVKDKEGKIKRYRIPAGINQSSENFRDAKLNTVLSLQEQLKDPTLNSKERKYLEDEYQAALQEAHLYHSQLLVKNKTAEQTLYPYSN